MRYATMGRIIAAVQVVPCKTETSSLGSIDEEGAHTYANIHNNQVIYTKLQKEGETGE